MTKADQDPAATPIFTETLQKVVLEASDVARAALREIAGSAIGAHLGASCEADFTATHTFDADLPGYRGWRWQCVVAIVPGASGVTVDELSLSPGPQSLVAPEWLPWDQRLRPGDLGAGDLLPSNLDDERLVPGHVLTGDPAIDEVEAEIGLGRPRRLSRAGRVSAARRWAEGDFGPTSDHAKSSKFDCGTCGFLVHIAGELGAAFGVCANEYSADGNVVHLNYGCGAHSSVEAISGQGSPDADAYDDGAIDIVNFFHTATGAES